MKVRAFFGSLKNLLKVSFLFKGIFKGYQSARCEKLTSLPGIGINNCRVFYDAGYKTPEAIISAEDKDLMNLPGVGTAFIKRLREYDASL